MIFSDDPESWRMRLVWDTSIIPGLTGVEQRAALQATPELEFEAEYVLDVATLQRVRLELLTNPTGSHELPVWAFESQVAVTTTTIVVALLDASMVYTVGRRLLLRAPGLADQARSVTVVTDGPGLAEYTLTLNSAITIPASGTMTMLPLAEIYLRDNQTTGSYRQFEVGRFNLSAICKTRYGSLGAGAEDIAQHGGLHLLDLAPSIEGDIIEQHQAQLGGLGDDMAPRVPTTGMETGMIARPSISSWGSREDRQWWFNFFFTVKGRATPFLFPTWRPDLELADDVAADPDNLLVNKEAVSYEAVWQASTHRHLALMYADGTFQAVTVESVTDNLDGTLSLALAATADASEEPAYISFLETVRLSSDAIEFDCKAGHAKFDLPMVTTLSPPVIPGGS